MRYSKDVVKCVLIVALMFLGSLAVVIYCVQMERLIHGG